jgi:hypothetical protein
MVLRLLLLIMLAAGLVVVAGCGGDDSSTSASETVAATTTEEGEEEEETSTPEEALAEIQAIGPLLDAAVSQYAGGENDAAEEAVGDIYLEHFEKVEGPLGEVNHDLMEELEEMISTELRTAMREGETVEDVQSLAAEIHLKLADAEEALG